MTFKWFARYWIFCYNVNKHDDVINIAEIRDQLGSLALADINTSVRTPKPKHPNSTNLPLELQNKSPVAFTKLKLGWRRRRKYMVNASPKPCWPKGKSTPNSGGIQTTYPCLQGPLSQTRPKSSPGVVEEVRKPALQMLQTTRSKQKTLSAIYNMQHCPGMECTHWRAD